MIDQIVDFLTSAVSAGVNLSGQLFNATGTWPLVFAGFSIIMISRFILGPILGFTFSGSSDLASSKKKSSSKTVYTDLDD